MEYTKNCAIHLQYVTMQTFNELNSILFNYVLATDYSVLVKKAELS